MPQINFNGIQNIGYVRVTNNDTYGRSSRCAMSMELTDDAVHKDLTEYRKIIKANPILTNEINDKFVNIEFETKSIGDLTIIINKLNGTPILGTPANAKLIGFMKNLLNRITNFKEKDFKVDKDFHLTLVANENLIYNEPIDNYIDGTSGRVGLLEGTGLTEKFDLYMNSVPDDIDEEELNLRDEQISKAIGDVVATLHEPAYVSNGAIYMNALMQGYAKSLNQYN